MRHLAVLRSLLIAASWLIGGVLSAQALVIDDFQSGPGFGIVTPSQENPDGLGRRFDVGLSTDSVLGGERQIDFRACFGFGGSTGPMPLVHDPNSGHFIAGGTPGSLFCEGPGFSYGNEFGWATESDLDLDLRQYNAVLIDLLHLDPGEPNTWYDPETRRPEISVRIGTTYMSTTGQFRTASVGGVIAVEPTGSPATIAVPLDLTGGGPSDLFDASDVDMVNVYFANLGLGGGFGVSEFRFAYLPALDGDYNRDGRVDTNDLDQYVFDYGRDYYGSFRGPREFGVLADGNADGVVNAADYTVWRDAYNHPFGRATAALPEPCGMALAGVATLIGARSRR